MWVGLIQQEGLERKDWDTSKKKELCLQTAFGLKTATHTLHRASSLLCKRGTYRPLQSSKPNPPNQIFKRKREKEFPLILVLFLWRTPVQLRQEQSGHAEESRAKAVIGDTRQSLDRIQSKAPLYQPGWFQQHNRKPNCLNVEMSNLQSRNPSGRTGFMVSWSGSSVMSSKKQVLSISLLHYPWCFFSNLMITIRATHVLLHIQWERMDICGSVSQKWRWFFLHVALIQTGIGLPNPEPLIVIIKGVGRAGITMIGLN